MNNYKATLFALPFEIKLFIMVLRDRYKEIKTFCRCISCLQCTKKPIKSLK